MDKAHLLNNEEQYTKGGIMFYKKDDLGYKEPMEGVRMKTLTHGEKTLMAEFRVKKGGILPEHTHPHEQIGYLISGRIAFIIDGERKVAESGDSWCIHSDVPHSAEMVEDSVVIEVFSPVREDYLP
jgi:quercetin dioxygenase-like cupin family protein